MQKSETDGFFFYSKRKSGEKWSFQKLIFPHFFVFFIFFFDQHKNRKFDVDTVSKVILWHLRVLCTQLKEKKVEKNHFEHKIHWVFAGFEHKIVVPKLKFWWKILIFSFVRSFSKKLSDEPELRQIMRSHLILLYRGLTQP